MRKLIGLITFVVLTFAFLYPASAAIVFSDDFSGDLSQWTVFGAGTWAIESGELSKDLGWGWVEGGNDAWTDYSFECKIKAMDDAQQTIRIKARLSPDTLNNYELQYNPLWGVLRLGLMVDGISTWKSSTTIETKQVGEEFTLKIVLSGSSITGWFDGTPRVSMVDNTFTQGKIGLGGNRHAHFDDIVVQNPIPPPDLNFVPEYPLGTVLAFIAMLTALGVYKSKRIRIRK